MGIVTAALTGGEVDSLFPDHRVNPVFRGNVSALLDAKFGQPWSSTMVEPYFRDLKRRVTNRESARQVAVLVSGAARTMANEEAVKEYQMLFARMHKLGLNVSVFAYLNCAPHGERIKGAGYSPFVPVASSEAVRTQKLEAAIRQWGAGLRGYFYEFKQYVVETRVFRKAQTFSVTPERNEKPLVETNVESSCVSIRCTEKPGSFSWKCLS